MSKARKYYRNIDLIRVIACFAILLYHLNILKGGYLAVCTFFVLSGYLSFISLFKKDDFSFKSYYLNRLLKIYLPLLIVVFVTISIISIFPNIIWLNLKPETTSVLFGYNNFWQLGANLDYFARHVSSPFMHLWYISILLQFDLIFPFIYLILRKIGDKINKLVPCAVMIALSVIFAIVFYKSCITNNIMSTYYNTFTRVFSLLMGVSLGAIHSYFKPLVSKVLKNKNNIIFYSYLLVLICLFIFVDAESIFFPISMVLSSLVTCRLIDYSVLDRKRKLNKFYKVVKSLSSVSYEIYLVQYPIIYWFQYYVTMNNYLKTILIIVLVLFISYLLHFVLDLKNEKCKKVRYVIGGLVLAISIYGVYQYCIAKDHTAEMKQLEEQLARNEEIALEKQKEYEEKIKNEQNAWFETLNDLKSGEEEIKKVVTDLPVVGIGDSILLGAVNNLYQTFPNGYFDGKVSRTAYEAEGIINGLKNKNAFGGPVVFNLGANGDCSMACKEKIVELCDDREVFWLTVTNDSDVHFNHKLDELAQKYSNFHIIDWAKISKGHKEYFVSDGIHLTESGRKEYSRVINDAIYKVYLDEYNLKKEEILKKHEEELKTKISFYGGEVLLNTYDYLQNDFPDSKFVIDKEFDFNKLKETIKKEIADNTLTYRLVFLFDNLSEEEYKELVELCDGHEISILLTNKSISNIDNATIIDFYQSIKSNDDYLMADKIHLTEVGKQALNNTLNSVLKKVD